jgi:hypothetical protein
MTQVFLKVLLVEQKAKPLPLWAFKKSVRQVPVILLKPLNAVRIRNMKALRNLPDNFVFESKFDLNNQKLLVGLNVAGLILTLFFFVLFSRLTAWLRPDMQREFLFAFRGIWNIVFNLLGLLVTILAVLSLHEAVHGFFFWLFSRHKPVFGFKLAYAYAAMPDWYFPRNQYLIIGAAPFVLLNLLGILLLILVPLNWVWVVFAALMMNSSGAVGDLAVILWLLRRSASALALDKADSIELYLPTQP